MKRIKNPLRWIFHGRDNFESLAKKILGKDRVLGHACVSEALGKKIDPYTGDDYSQHSLEVCAEANQNGADCYAVFRAAISIYDLTEAMVEEFAPSQFIFGYNPALLYRQKAGFRLIDMSLDSKLSIPVSAAHALTVALTLATLKKVSGKKLLPDKFHVGEKTGEDFLLVGGYDQSGILMYLADCNSLTRFPEVFGAVSLKCVIPVTPSLA